MHIDPHSSPSVVFSDDADSSLVCCEAEKEEDGSLVQERSTGRRQPIDQHHRQVQPTTAAAESRPDMRHR